MKFYAINAGWAIAIVILVAMTRLIQFHAANADELASLTLIGELWQSSAPFRWMLQPANGAFPDLLIAAAIYTAGFEGVLYYIIYAGIYAVLLFVLTAVILQYAGLEKTTAWTGAVFSVLLIGVIDSAHPYIHQLIFLPTGHGGVVPMALLCFAMVTHSIQRKAPAVTVLFVLVAVATFSDMLTVPHLVLPVVATTILVGWQRPDLGRIATVIVLTFIGAAIAGMAIYFAIPVTGVFDNGTLGLRPFLMLSAVTAYVRTLPQTISIVGYPRGILVVAGMVIGIVVTIRSVFTRRVVDNLPIVLMTFSGLGGLLGTIAVGAYMEPALMRQQLPFFSMPIIVLIWALCRTLRGHIQFLSPIAAALAIYLFSQSAASAWHKSLALNPSYVRIADALASIQADLVLANYWDTKPIYLASDRHLMTCAVTEAGFPYIWVTNFGWCTEGLKRWSKRRNWLVIDTNLSDREKLIAKYGSPDHEEELAGHRALLYAWSADRETLVHGIVCNAVGRFKRLAPC
jgi:hypothetical protein